MFGYFVNRFRSYLCLALLLGTAVSSAQATPLSIRPIEFGGGVVASGTLVTDDTTGNIVDWNLSVRTTERLAHYSKANTGALAVEKTSVTADGQRLNVATSSDPATEDGGQLFFRSPNPFVDFGAMLADFTGANAYGGQAMYMAGGSFDFMSLNAPNASDYTVAERGDPSTYVFSIAPLLFANGVTLSGSLVTDGTLGALTAANILKWDIFIDQIIEDVFDKTNSAMSSDLVRFDPTLGQLVTSNPDGALWFNKPPLGGRQYALVLADFTDPFWPKGKAAYYQGRLASHELSLGAKRGSWEITGTEPITVPEPTSIALLGVGLAGIGYRRRCKRAV